MSPPPSPVVSTIGRVGLGQRRRPATLGNPSPIDWNAVPTIIIRSGEATGQYMFAQPMKWPPSETTTRSVGQQLGDAAPRADARVEAPVGGEPVAGVS